MQSVFKTAPAVSAVPITFVTKANWEAISNELPAGGAAVRASQRICGKARKMPDVAGSRRHDCAGLVRPRGRGQRIARPVPAWRPAGVAAARRLPLRQRAARHTPRRARLRIGKLPLRPLPQGRTARGQPGAAGRYRCRRHHADGGSGLPRARPHQHAVQRHGAGGAGAGRRKRSPRGSGPASPASSATSS